MPNDKEPVGKGCALWVMPAEPMFSLLADRISSLSRQLSTPLFEPHVTLLAGITLPEEESVKRCSSLASGLKPFRIELGETGQTDEYFRCVFASVIPAEPIMYAHRMAGKTFAIRDDAPYTPHVSLLYGYLQIEERKEIATAHRFLSGHAFEVLRLALYHVTGATSEWRRVKEFDFG